MPIRCVLFDHDDTLLPTFKFRVQCLETAAIEVLGRAVDARGLLAGAQGRNLESIALEAAGGDEAAAPRLVTFYRRHYGLVDRSSLAPYAGITDTLAALRDGGLRIAVVTSKQSANARRELAMTGLESFIETLVGADDVERHKPDPEPLRRAMQRLQATPAETLMVGDTRADVLGARNAGVTSVGALWGALDRNALRALAPDHLLEHPVELLTLVGG